MDEVLWQEALTLAEQYPLHSGALNNASRAVVRKPDAFAEAHRHALLQGEEACRQVPQHGNYVIPLGMGQYRLGQYQVAVKTLARSEKPNTTPADRSHPSDLTFLAMGQCQLGQKERAQATLVRLREALTKPWWAKDPQNPAFLREAERLIKEGKQLP